MPRPEREADARRSLDRLASLRIDPAARSRFAAELLAESGSPSILFPAAAALEEHPLPGARDALIGAYGRVAAQARKLDSGGALRAALMRAIRSVAVAADVPLLEEAACTYESSVQGPGATELRAAALVALLEAAPEAAVLQAARILAEADDPRCTHSGSGEPAVTAARVLGAAGQTALLYFAALQAWRPPDEVLAECLRQLVTLPDGTIASLVARFSSHPGDLVQLGLVDLLTESQTAPAEPLAPYVAWLRAARPDIYGYALAAFVASRRTPLHELAAATVREEFDRDRLAIAAEALALARGAAILEAARDVAAERLGAGRQHRR
jgi:hypothetical protein